MRCRSHKCSPVIVLLQRQLVPGVTTIAYWKARPRSALVDPQADRSGYAPPLVPFSCLLLSTTSSTSAPVAMHGSTRPRDTHASSSHTASDPSERTYNRRPSTARREATAVASWRELQARPNSPHRSAISPAPPACASAPHACDADAGCRRLRFQPTNRDPAPPRQPPRAPGHHVGRMRLHLRIRCAR